MELKIGDKVLLKNERGKSWNCFGDMDKFKGKTVTVKNLYNDNCFTIIESYDYDWSFSIDDIEKKIENTIEYDNKKYNVTKCDEEVLVAERLNEPILDEEDKKTIKMGADLLIRCGAKPEDITVSKNDDYPYEFINILDNENITDISLKLFKAGKMYKNMEIDKEYTLKELGVE